MRITLAQTDSTLGDVAANVERTERVLSDVAAERPDVVAFPELCLSGYSVGSVDDDLSMRSDDERLVRLAKQAGGAGLQIGFVEDGLWGLHTYDSVAYCENGRVVHVHRKLCLPTYGIFEERKHFTPGSSLRSFPVGGRHRAATLLCYDAWQPQLAFLAAQKGANILFVPAASAQESFSATYDDARTYWRDITRFYARMFQLFVVFVNRVGTEESLHFWGGSHVVDPWGEIIAQAPEEKEAVITVDIDLSEVRRRRRALPLAREAPLDLLHREMTQLLGEGR